MIDHVQINDVVPRIRYNCSGTQNSFTFPFAIFKVADLAVWLGGVPQSSGFTVSGIGISTGGTVLFTVPPPPGTTVTLRRRLVLERVSDFQTDGIIRAKTLNDELDYQIAALQQVAEGVGRALTLSPISAAVVDLTLPDPVAGRGLKWDASGGALVNSDHDPDTVGDVIQAASDAVEAAEAAATARDQAVAAAGKVKVSANDATLGQLAVKLVAGSGITLTEQADGGDERLSIAAAVPQAITDRLAFLERNLAITVLRDQIDTGWSVLKMVDGIADEFEDLTGISNIGTATYDSVGDYIANPGGAQLIAQAMGTNFGGFTVNGGIAAAIDGNTAQASGVCSHSGAFTGWTTVNGRVYSASKTLTGMKLWGPTDTNVSQGGAISYRIQTSTDTTNGVTGTWTDRDTGTIATGTALVLDRSNVFSVAGIGIRVQFNGTGNSGDVAEVQFFEAVLPPNVTVVSTATTADSVPVEARLVMLHQPMVATLNTDFIAEISRDGGTTWTAATLTNEGAFDTAINVVCAVVDVSAQPSGNSMKWRIRTLTNKEQRLHGVWLQWR